MPFRVMMVAGEASGDLHGAGVVRELKRRDQGTEILGIGGDNMRAEGMEIVCHISELSFMGFVEVLRNLPKVHRTERLLDGLLESRRPDVVVLIDYPGFNLRFASRVKAKGIPVLYYISPQVWAWHPRRVRHMRGVVDRMKVVFPFEVEIYRREGIDVEFVGHPIVERIGSHMTRDEFFAANGFSGERKLIGLFPGSRKQEIEHILPTMMKAAAGLSRSIGAQIGIGVAPNLGPEFLRRFITDAGDAKLVEHGTYDLMAHADAAVVTSGTATLETGWFGTPMAVVYKTSPLTYMIGRLLVHVPYIGLVNIVAGKKVVPEFVQHEMTETNIREAATKMLVDASYASAMRRDLAVIREKMGGPGASARVAEGIRKLCAS